MDLVGSMLVGGRGVVGLGWTRLDWVGLIFAKSAASRDQNGRPDLTAEIAESAKKDRGGKSLMERTFFEML